MAQYVTRPSILAVVCCLFTLIMNVKAEAGKAAGASTLNEQARPSKADLTVPALTVSPLVQIEKQQAATFTPESQATSYYSNGRAQLKRGSVVTKPSTHSDTFHHNRHDHTDVPTWLKKHLDQSFLRGEIGVKSTEIEEGIAAIFRDVAYGRHKQKSFVKLTAGSGNRYERTTALSDAPDYNYIADENLPISGRREIGVDISDPLFVDASVVVDKNNTLESSVEDNNSQEEISISESPSSTALNDEAFQPLNTTQSDHNRDVSAVESIPEVEMFDEELYDLYEGHYSELFSDDISDVTRRGDSLLGNATVQSSDKIQNNMTEESISKLPIPNLSWFDYLLCTNRNMAWILINFLLGLLLLGVSVFAPYRLLTLRSCTHILPRTHFVSVHLLVFVSVSLKALYMFHLAFGGKERLPLVLILILTNNSIPCFISAYMILMIMMFLTADVQVYKPKLLTMHNVSIFIVMMIVLSFVSDIIVGSAHSKSVLVLSRIMLIGIATVVIVFYIRKHPRVMQAVEILKREFQGELKLLVVPSKDSPQQKQMDIKHILRNRLHRWCQCMKIATGTLAVCCLIHFIHAIFLISSQVPSWAWWTFHTCGTLVEATTGVILCIVAALTQRYNEESSFISHLFLPSILSRNKKKVTSKESNGNVIYQRVSYSSGTESTQYTSCTSSVTPAIPVVTARSPKPPRRRTATVRRSATFSYAPQVPRGPRRPCQPPVPNLSMLRTGSASQIPVFSTGSATHLSDIYSPASISHVPVYSPSSVRSMLVHEDGFVRIRSQIDPNERYSYRGNPPAGLYDPNRFRAGSNPQIHNANLQQWNGLGSRENFYNCLPRRRRSSRSSSFHQHNSPIAENDTQSGSSGRLQTESFSISQEPHQRTMDPNYHSFSRRRNRSRESSLKHLNNFDKEAEELNLNKTRRVSSKALNLQHMNNLDRSDEDYQRLGRRKLSRDDNNEPIYYNSSHEGNNNMFPDTKISSSGVKVPSLNLTDKDKVSPISQASGSPSIRRKISNISSSHVRPVHSPSPVHGTSVGYSPSSSRREAHFPKPFSLRGSNASLKSEDLPYLEHYQRTNPVRRNHSAAGYFPSRYLLPTEGSLADDTQRYGSLRIGMVKKRQPGYVLQTNTSKLINKYMEKYPKSASEEDNFQGESSEYGIPNKVTKKSRTANQDLEGNVIKEGDANEGDRSQGAANTSKGSDADWALELITSSSMLTDFYSLKRPKKEDKGEG